MTTQSLLSINLLSPVLFYQNPVDIYQTQNGSTQMYGGGPCEMNCNRMCNQNLASNNPASQYQRQKLIQKTVRVGASLYTMNLAGLSSYQKPLKHPFIVEQNGTPYVIPANTYWNQMSDRAKPAHQTTKVASGSGYHASSTRHTITRHRPGAMSPGGIGVDIKHNSYDRYLNKLKGKAPLRRGVIPPNYGAPIPFNRAYPVYGGKIVKTAIVNGCHCPEADEKQDAYIYASTKNALQDQILSVKYEFHVGDFVWVQKSETVSAVTKAEIVAINNGNYSVKFEDGLVKVLPYCSLNIYFDCDTCNATKSIIDDVLEGVDTSAQSDFYCNLLNLTASSATFI